MHRFGSGKDSVDHDSVARGIERLEGLLADLRILGKGSYDWHRIYNDRERDAPILENWALAARPVPCLVGLSTGHPLLPGHGRPIVTSEVWLISEELDLARTLSRWYRLGTPSGQVSKES